MKLINKILIPFLAVFIFLSFSVFVFADTTSDKLDDLNSKIEEYEKTIKELKGQQQTLKSTISFLNNKISLTQAQVSKTEKEIEILEKEIDKLSVKIVILDRTLNDISKILSSRITATYKSSYIKPAYLLFSTSDFSSLLSKIKYLKVAQAHDHSLMMQMEKQKKNYDDQKDLKEEKQAEMEKLKQTLKVQTAALAQQQQSKQQLLEVTKNDENKYQKLVSEARQEVASLLASKFTGKRHVKRGEVLGLMGSTGFSTGPHLHFGVYNLSEENASKFDYYNDAGNPFNYLASKSVVFYETSCDDVSTDQDKTVGGGSWMWPMDNPKITQCYGHTPHSWMYGNNFHQGIDIFSSSLPVRSVDEGEAYFYKGETNLGNNVRVFHPDGKMTLYLHFQ